jgi:6-phosphogluconolactonase
MLVPRPGHRAFGESDVPRWFSNSRKIQSLGRTGRAATLLSGLLITAGTLAQTPATHTSNVSFSRPAKAVVYAAVGAELTHYDLDLEAATLNKRDSVMLPDSVQYAWPHPSRKYFYVAWSNGAGANHHGVSAFRIDSASGSLIPLGQPVSLPARPIHLTTDIPGTHVLIAFNEPSGVTVHRLGADGMISSQVQQPGSLDTGIYAHQVRVDPSNKMVILVTRGNGPTSSKAEDPGALKVFSYQDGIITNRASIAPGGGFGFQPRHLDFLGKWVFVSLERQNKLQVYRKLDDGTLTREPVFTRDSVTDPTNIHRGQAAGTVHVHPNGKFLYQANRAGGTVDFEGKAVFAGGENAIAVYAINQTTGEPMLIQNADTHGSTPRTFALDATGRILVAANQNAMLVREGQQVRMIPAGLSVFRVRGDGKLDFMHKYDVATDGAKNLFWMGVVSLP